jgi:hypothetical protein
MGTNVKAFLILILITLSAIPMANAQSIAIQASKSEYHYGDYLSITISVQKVTGKNAILYIIDSQGTKSSAIPVQITNQTTTITTPVPFNVEVFKEGKYQIQIEYDNTISSTSFQLVDVGNLVLPFGSNIIVPQWTSGAITDTMFFKFLVEKDVIKISGKLSDKTDIPDWYKTNAKWWTERKISDSEFIKGLQYLVEQRIVKP